MIGKLLGFFSGWNGQNTLDQTKRHARSNVIALLYQKIKFSTPGIMKQWSILGSVESDHTPEDIANVITRITSGETLAIKVEESNSFTDRVVLHQVLTREGKIFLYFFKDTKFSNGFDDYLTMTEISNKFPTDHLPKESKIIQ